MNEGEEMQLMDFKHRMLERFGQGEPIILKGIDAEKFGMTKASLRKAFDRLENEGEINRFSNGVYYFPQYSKLLKKSLPLLPEKVIENKYVKNDEEILGFISGLGLLNNLGLTTQVPKVQTIVTENVSKNMRVTEGDFQEVNLVKAKVDINKDNYRYLQLFEILDQYFQYIEPSEADAIQNLSIYLNESRKTVKRSDLIQWLYHYPSRVVAKFLDKRYEALLPEE
jgi:hypothetical protein